MTTDTIPEPITAIGPRSINWAADHTDAEWARFAEGFELYARACYQRAADSFERCDTDGFLSQWGAGVSGREARFAAKLAEAHGFDTAPALFDAATGEPVAAKLIETRYGFAWGVLASDDPHSAVVRWINLSYAKTHARRAAHYAKHGVTVGTVRVRVRPRMSDGMTPVEYAERVDRGFSRDAEVIDRDGWNLDD